jgi:hypothetical protein
MTDTTKPAEGPSSPAAVATAALLPVPRPSRHSAWLIDILFGKRHWCGKWVARLCEADPGFFNHLAEQGPEFPHFLCLVHLATSQDCGSGFANLTPAAQAKEIRTTSRRALLQRLYGECPPGLLTILCKLGPRPLARERYRNLMALRTDRPTLSRLTHRERVPAAEVNTLADLPPVLRTLPVFTGITNGKHKEIVRYLLDAARILRPDLDEAALARTLRGVRDLNQLARWTRRQIKRRQFPPPPWEGCERVRPVRTVSELHAVVRRFQNCARSYVSAALAGDVYFYVVEWGPALIMLRRDPLLGWWLDEYAGLKNKKLPGPLVRSIRSTLTDAGIRAHRTHKDVQQVLLDDFDDIDVYDWLELPRHTQ